MKAIHLTAYGNPAENLKLVEVAEPNAPSAGEALVRMEYAPIAYSDLLLAEGVYLLRPKLPSVIGGEGVGIVEAIGPGVASVKVGDRVTIPFGTFTWSEKVVAPAWPDQGLFVVPASIDARTASMLNINPTTAVLLLSEFVKLKPKDWIVINAANSQIARCIIAIAKSRDLKVAGIVRRSELVPEIEKLGVDFVGVESPELPKQIQSAAVGIPITLGLDAVGGPETAMIASVLSPGVHPKAPSLQHDAVFRWMLSGADSLGEREVKRKVRGEDRIAKYGAVGELPKLIQAFEQAKRASIAGEIVKLIDEFDLPREAIPTQWLNEAVVWEALLERMPMTAMIRNLGKRTSLGLIKPFSDAKKLVLRKLKEETALKRSRIHPLAVLVAQKIYAQGHGNKGALKWSPVSAIVDALDAAFYATFSNVEPCSKPVLLALDVSGSMAASNIAGSCISAREASAAMALITSAT